MKTALAMIRFVFQLAIMIALLCICLIIATLAVGNTLPPEDEIAFSAKLNGADFDIYRMSIVRRIAVPITHNEYDDFQSTWSPDGQQLAFVSKRSGFKDLYRMDTQGENVHLLTEGLRNVFDPAWSPDGKQIALTSDRYQESRELLLFDIATGSIHRLTEENNMPDYPAWSPDGKQIAFGFSKGNTHVDIYRLDIPTGVVTPLIVRPDYDIYPSWSADGRYLAYINGFQHLNIYLWDIANAYSILLYAPPDFIVRTLDWSPDSRFIVYTAGSGTTARHTKIFKLNVEDCLRQPDTCSPDVLTVVPANYEDPRWRPHTP